MPNKKTNLGSKIWSLVLCVSILLSCMSVPAFAQTGGTLVGQIGATAIGETGGTENESTPESTGGTENEEPTESTGGTDNEAPEDNTAGTAYGQVTGSCTCGSSYINGICSNADCTDPYQAPEGDGSEENPYQISNAGNLYWFAARVNGGNQGIYGKLTADIVVNPGTFDKDGTYTAKDGETLRAWTPIGATRDDKYKGIFDGDEYSVSGLYVNDESKEYVGLFGYLDGEATVENITVKGSYFCGRYYVGGIAGYNYGGTLTNCTNSGTVTGSDYVGGIAGCNNGGTLTNCTNSGTATGNSTVGGIAGYNNGSTLTNCTNSGTVTDGTYVGGIAGYSYSCTLTNCTNSGAVTGWDYIGGIAGYNKNGKIENCENKATITGSEKVGGIVGYNINGTDVATITNCKNAGAVSGSDSYVGGIAGDNIGGRVINCENSAKVMSTGVSDITQAVGGIVGYNSDDGEVSNCKNSGDVSGIVNIGGIVGWEKELGKVTLCENTGAISGWSGVGGILGGSYNYNITLSDCVNSGAVTGKSFTYGETEYPSQCIGGIVGMDCDVLRCINTGTVTGGKQVGSIVGEKEYGSVENSYYLSAVETDDGGKTAAQFKSGEVTYLLNGSRSEGTEDDPIYWYQTLDGTSYPGFTGGTVYPKTRNGGCGQAPDQFSNTAGETFVGEHKIDNCTQNDDGATHKEVCSNCGETVEENAACTFENGFCTGCGRYEAPAQVDGAYQIANAGNLFWFAAQVNSGNTSINGKLTADITVNTGVLKADGSLNEGTFRTWTPIGTKDEHYTGTFDGDGHSISGLYFNDESKSWVGLFGRVSTNGEVKNVAVKDSYFKGNNNVGGVVGYNGGSGMVANCYNIGTVSGNNYVGGVAGYNGGYGMVENCYNIGTVSGDFWYVGGVIGCNIGTVTNCYYLTGCAKGDNNTVQYGIGHAQNESTTADVDGATTGKTAAQFASGEVAWLLNGQKSDGAWKQTLGTDDFPNFTSTQSVYFCTNCVGTVFYTNDSTIENGVHDFDDKGFCKRDGTHYQPAVLNGDVYEISNAGQLFWFAAQVNSGNTKINGKLTADIDLENRAWTPIGTKDKPYTGTFDGNEKTIENLKITATADFQGLFGVIYGGAVKDLTLKGKIEITAKVNNVGGLTGYAQNGTKIENVISYVTITDSRTDIDTTSTNNRIVHVGGIVASLEESTIRNSAYYGTITVQFAERIGGIVGIVSGSDSSVSHCTNRGNVTANDSSAHVAGITGDAKTGAHVDHCLNYGKVVSGGDDCIGGIVGYANQNVQIEYCGNIGDVECTFSDGGYIGGILGYVNDESFKLLANCFNYGKITSNSGSKNHPGAIVGWVNTNTTVNDTIFCNNYYLTGSCSQVSDGKTIPSVTAVTATQFSSGEVAYKLGGEWKQTLGTDAYPNFDGKTVYYGYRTCADEQKYYANSAVSATPIAHTYGEEGICTSTEGQIHYQPAVLNGDYYEISNAGQLFWFANYVNSGNAGANAKLMADIDLEGRLWTPIGLYSDDPAISKNNHQYTGTFDGNDHVIKNLYVEMTENYEAGLFSRVATGGVLKNFGVVNATVKQNQDGHEGKGVRAGIVAGEIYRGTVENVFTAGTLVLETQHDQFGGLAGECKESALTNCYTTMGRLTDGTSGNTPKSVTNCYYCADSENADSAGMNMTEAQFTSGEVAYRLNGQTSEGSLYWYQTCGEGYPVLKNDGNIVYYFTDCKGDPHYSNTKTENGSHIYDNGFCTLCDTYQPCEQDESGVYLIKNAGNLYWFAAQVNGGATSINGKLTANITLNPGTFNESGNYTAVDGENISIWTPIGTSDKPYTGIFDGDGHSISGLYFNDSNKSHVGLFGYVQNATLKAITLKNAYVKGYINVGGVVGCIYDGTVTNCYYLAGCAKDGSNTVQYGIGHEDKGSTTADVDGVTTGKTVYYDEESRYYNEKFTSVTITWTSMEFTYTDGTWSPDKHDNDEGTWSAGEGGGTVTVENTGNVTITVGLQFTSAITGITGSFDKSSFDIAPEESQTETLTLTGKLSKNSSNERIGSITVTIAQKIE